MHRRYFVTKVTKRRCAEILYTPYQPTIGDVCIFGLLFVGRKAMEIIMKTTIHGGFLLIFSVLQATWLDCIEIFGIKPNLFLIYIIVVCCFCDRIEGGAVGFVAGFALDMLVGGIWGLNSVIGLLLGFCISHFYARIISNNNLLVTLAFVLAGTLLYESIFCFIAFMRTENVSFFQSLAKIVLPECGYNMVASVPLYFIIKRFAKFLYTDKGDVIG